MKLLERRETFMYSGASGACESEPAACRRASGSAGVDVCAEIDHGLAIDFVAERQGRGMAPFSLHVAYLVRAFAHRGTCYVNAKACCRDVSHGVTPSLGNARAWGWMNVVITATCPWAHHV